MWLSPDAPHVKEDWSDRVHSALKTWCLLDRWLATTFRCPGMWWRTKVKCLLSACSRRCTVWQYKDHERVPSWILIWSGPWQQSCPSSPSQTCSLPTAEVQAELLAAPRCWCGRSSVASFSARSVVRGQVYPLPTLSRGVGEELKLRKVGRGEWNPLQKVGWWSPPL